MHIKQSNNRQHITIDLKKISNIAYYINVYIVLNISIPFSSIHFFSRSAMAIMILIKYTLINPSASINLDYFL